MRSVASPTRTRVRLTGGPGCGAGHRSIGLVPPVSGSRTHGRAVPPTRFDGCRSPCARLPRRGCCPRGSIRLPPPPVRWSAASARLSCCAAGTEGRTIGSSVRSDIRGYVLARAGAFDVDVPRFSGGRGITDQAGRCRSSTDRRLCGPPRRCQDTGRGPHGPRCFTASARNLLLRISYPAAGSGRLGP
jgi:hypothetical protein